MYREQTLAEHSHQVTMIALKLAEEWFKITDSEQLLILLKYALMHDAHEVEFGDIPTPVKEFMSSDGYDLFWEDEDVSAISNTVKSIVSLADRIEQVLYYSEQGPDHDVMGYVQDKLKTKVGTFENGGELYHYVARTFLPE
jgi:5'-deoxynucleotidase YfbR-like HD superfamily hydrolase